MIGHIYRAITIVSLWWRCRCSRTVTECLATMWSVLCEQGLVYQYTGPPLDIHQPSFILLNHTYDFYVLQSLINMAYIHHVIPFPLRVVCETTYTSMMPPPLSTMTDRLFTNEIRISRKHDDRLTKRQKLSTGIQQALKDGYCVVLYGDIDAVKPLRTLYKCVLDDFRSIPKYVFHFGEHGCTTFSGTYIPTSSSGRLSTTDEIIAYRHRVDPRFRSRIDRSVT